MFETKIFQKTVGAVLTVLFLSSCSAETDKKTWPQDNLTELGKCVDDAAIAKGLRIDYDFFKNQSYLYTKIINSFSSKDPKEQLKEAFVSCAFKFKLHEKPKSIQSEEIDSVLTALVQRGMSDEEITQFKKSNVFSPN